MRIIPASSTKHISIARELFEEYAEWLGVNLCFQHFDRELDELPGDYAPPSGMLHLAFIDYEPAGCVAVRGLGKGVCEMKRLWVRPAFQGKGVGRALIEGIVKSAIEIGYERMRLDTLPERMAAANHVYRSLGFRPIAKYYDNPNEGVEYLELTLRSPERNDVKQ